MDSLLSHKTLDRLLTLMLIPFLQSCYIAEQDFHRALDLETENGSKDSFKNSFQGLHFYAEMQEAKRGEC